MAKKPQEVLLPLESTETSDSDGTSKIRFHEENADIEDKESMDIVAQEPAAIEDYLRQDASVEPARKKTNLKSVIALSKLAQKKTASTSRPMTRSVSRQMFSGDEDNSDEDI